MRAGIYYIRCTVNGKVYIGVTGDIDLRLKTHLSRLGRDSHTSRTMQADWNAYGASAFETGALEELSTPYNNAENHTRERYWIDRCEARDPKRGYNADFKVLRNEQVAKLRSQPNTQRRALEALADKLTRAAQLATADGRQMDAALYRRQAAAVQQELNQ